MIIHADRKGRLIITLLCVLVICAGVFLYMFCFMRKTPMQIARENPSETGWTIVCDTKEHTLYIYRQPIDVGEDQWEPALYKSFPCATGVPVEIDGKMVSRTPKGRTSIHFKERSHVFEDCRSWYNCWCRGGFGIHSTMYARDETSPEHEVDGRLGIDASRRCIRVKLNVAKWIYTVIPEETPVVIF